MNKELFEKAKQKEYEIRAFKDLHTHFENANFPFTVFAFTSETNTRCQQYKQIFDEHIAGFKTKILNLIE